MPLVCTESGRNIHRKSEKRASSDMSRHGSWNNKIEGNYICIQLYGYWQVVWNAFHFLFGSHADLSAVAQTRPYGLRQGLGADS